MSQQLVEAIWEGKTELALILLDDANVLANINEFFPAQDKTEKVRSTCLYKALRYRRFELFEKLLHVQKVDVSKGTTNKLTILHYAARLGFSNYVKLILAAGCKVSACVDGNTPLHEACIKGHGLTLSYILEHDRTGINIKNNESMTPLHFAVLQGHLECVHVLVFRFNADTTVTDFTGETALMMSKRLRHELITNLLERREEIIIHPPPVARQRKKSDPYMKAPTAESTQSTQAVRQRRKSDPYMKAPIAETTQLNQAIIEQHEEQLKSQASEIQILREEVQTLKAEMQKLREIMQRSDLARDEIKTGDTDQRAGNEENK